MVSQPELIAPITVDLRAPDNRMDITKGIEFLKISDELMDASIVADDIELGDWLVLGPSNTLIEASSSAVPNTYPVWVGNDQYDAQATGQLTILTNGGFRYRTNKFVAGSYTNGQNLTVKSGTLPGPASGSDPILARVYKAPDAHGVMEIQVLDR